MSDGRGAHNGHQLCWDCANATNGRCSWSRELIPVPGWVARKVNARLYRGGEMIDGTYHVIDCPEFERDAYGFGQIRLEVNGGKDI